MARPYLEVADVLNQHGDSFVARHCGHLSLCQLKVMSAIRACRTAALGGHVARCTDCDHTLVSYNSCRNRHCPKCQGAAARQWLADLLPVPYYHVVFTLPAVIADVAYQNKAVVYDLLFRTAADTLITIAADRRHLGARIGLTAVLHSWGSALTHHPHVHMIVPGGGLSPDESRWIACRPGFFLPVRVLSRLFRRLFLDRLAALHEAGRLAFFGEQAGLADRAAFVTHLAPLRTAEWVVYSKQPFGGPEAVLAYLSRYTHRVAISNSRLLACDERTVTFRWKDYRARGKGAEWRKTMTVAADEFIRRFLIHVLPRGFHRIRHYGLLASGTRAAHVARIRSLLADVPAAGAHQAAYAAEPPPTIQPCPCCGGRMVVIESFGRGSTPRVRPVSAFRVDTSCRHASRRDHDCRAFGDDGLDEQPRWTKEEEGRLRLMLLILFANQSKPISRWLTAHPGIEVVSRDRGGGYGEASAKALSHAVQVADRWHLMENASSAFLDAVRRSMRAIRTAVGATVIDPALLTAAERLHYEGFLQREECNTAILKLVTDGVPIKQIVKRTGHSRNLVRQVVRGGCADVFRTRQSSLEAHLPLLDAHWVAGCHSGAELWRRLQMRGFCGSLRIHLPEARDNSQRRRGHSWIWAGKSPPRSRISRSTRSETSSISV